MVGGEAFHKLMIRFKSSIEPELDISALGWSAFVNTSQLDSGKIVSLKSLPC